MIFKCDCGDLRPVSTAHATPDGVLAVRVPLFCPRAWDKKSVTAKHSFKIQKSLQ